MAATANAPRVSRKGAPAIVAAFVVLLSVLSMSVPTARAAETKGEGRSSAADAGVMAWTPSLSPLHWLYESVAHHVTTEERNNFLHTCKSGHACVAAGEGNGLHTVYFLYTCTERSLSNFIGDGAVANNQTDSAQVVLKRQDGSTAQVIDAVSTERVDWDPIYYLDPC